MVIAVGTITGLLLKEMFGGVFPLQKPLTLRRN